MNQVLIDSWYFFRNNAKELFAFVLPVFALSMIAGFIGVISPENSILGILSIAQLMVGQLFTAGLLLLIANISKGEHPPHKDMLIQAIPFWVTIFMVTIITLMVVSVGLILIIPGLWLLLRLFLAPLYVVFQNKSVFDALRAAFVDSKDHLMPFFQTLVPFLVVGVIFTMFLITPPGQEQEPRSLLSMTLVNVGLIFGFVITNIIQFRLYTVHIESQSQDEEASEASGDED